MLLVNRINKEILKERLKNEPFRRRTLSFYRYIKVSDPVEFRNKLFSEWNALQCFGRIYVATEGINAQMSVPEHQLDEFLTALDNHSELRAMHIKFAIEDDGKSFYKLTIKVRPKIVADGLNEGTYDLSKTGEHLKAIDFHKAIGERDTIVVDMRNRYESEVGKFENAYCLDADTFKDAIHQVAELYKEEKDKKFLLYCTGGIRCEKASAYLIHEGFENVFQLNGGIIEYASQIKQESIPSKFIGKNFVFDERLGESIDGTIISQCHQCGKPCDTHTNCANNDCHMLFIQCPECSEKYDGCCSVDCKDIKALPIEERKKFRVLRHEKYSKSKIFNNNLRYAKL